MFLEQKGNKKSQKGWIEVICGSMFSGKTEELIRRIKRAEFANQKIEIYKPEMDHRYDKKDVVSHNKTTVSSIPVSNSKAIIELAKDVEVVGIDEAQFFDEDLPSVCATLSNNGARVIIAGLDMDFLGNPFGPIPALMSTAEFVTKVHAICLGCGDLAQFSHRKTKDDKIVLLGEIEEYEPLCRKCFYEAMNNNES